MDVAYNRSGASSRAHYQVVRNVENAPANTESLLLNEVERVRQRILSKNLSNSDIRKELIVLVYCLNTSAGAVNPQSLAFALPSAVHLAEAGAKVSEKHVGYMFCSEVMPRNHELELMLVNTLRKDIISSSISRMCLALEYLISHPFEDVVPAVAPRCTELLAHPSPRIKILSMHALHSLACFTPEVLHEEKTKMEIVNRLSDGDESVVRAALQVCLSLAKDGLLKLEELLERCISLLNSIADKQTDTSFPPIFRIATLSALADLLSEPSVNPSDYAKRIVPRLFVVLRRSVRSNSHPIIFGCFRLLGKLPPSIVTKYIISRSKAPTSPASGSTSNRSTSAQSIHPVSQIRHFLSSREINEHYLFLSCLSCLDPALWAGSPIQDDENENTLLDASSEKTKIKEMKLDPVLDQWEVERVLLSLESDDEGIRAMVDTVSSLAHSQAYTLDKTLQILLSMDLMLVETCYKRALTALHEASQVTPQNVRVEKNHRAISKLAQRALELALTISDESVKSGDVKSIAQKLEEITNALEPHGKANPEIVQGILVYVRKSSAPAQRELLLDLFHIICDDLHETSESLKAPVNSTLLLAFLALMTEIGPSVISVTSQTCKIIHGLASMLSVYAATMQEPILLTMTRLVLVLPPVDLQTTQIQDALRIVKDLLSSVPSMSSPKKASLLSKRCFQFKQAIEDPSSILDTLKDKEISSLPEFALLLEQVNPKSLPLSPKQENSRTIISGEPKSPESHSRRKLRYDAYAAPSIGASLKFGRARNTDSSPQVGTSDLKVIRSPSSASVSTATDRNENDRTPTNRVALIETTDPFVALDSPFITEPLVDVIDTKASSAPMSSSVITSTQAPLSASKSEISAGTPPYVSANTSLRATPEPAEDFEELWQGLPVNGGRGWYDGPVEDVVRQLQVLGLRMDVIPEDVGPFVGDLKISLRDKDSEDTDQARLCGLLRLHEEKDGSCLWQAKCSDKEFGISLKDLLR